MARERECDAIISRETVTQTHTRTTEEEEAKREIRGAREETRESAGNTSDYRHLRGKENERKRGKGKTDETTITPKKKD